MEETPYYLRTNTGSFGVYRPQDEYLHPEYKATVGPALTETHLFGFSVPEAAIHGFLYTWHHPNLGVVSGGAIVFQGIKSHAPAAELADYRYFMSDACLGGFPDYTLDSGYRVQMLEPGKTFRTTYADPLHDSRFDVLHTAAAEPIMWPGNKHFEQVMRTQGELVLHGKRYPVNGHHVRDRSWGQPRPEAPMDAPPTTWMTGVFNDDLAFNLLGTDDPASNPNWKTEYPNTDLSNPTKFSWILLEGRKTLIVSARKRTTYDPATAMPMQIDIALVDEHSTTHHIRGTVVAATPTHLWHNLRIPICLARWDYNGKVGWGDVQDSQASTFLINHH